MERVRFYFDFTSPYSYLASERVDAFAARTGASVDSVAAGAYGLPAFVLDDGELFFGNDRLDVLEWRLTRGQG